MEQMSTSVMPPLPSASAAFSQTERLSVDSLEVAVRMQSAGTDRYQR